MVRTPKGGVLPVSEVGKGLQTPEGARRRKEGEEAIPLCHFSTWDQAKPHGIQLRILHSSQRTSGGQLPHARCVATWCGHSSYLARLLWLGITCVSHLVNFHYCPSSRLLQAQKRKRHSRETRTSCGVTERGPAPERRSLPCRGEAMRFLQRGPPYCELHVRTRHTDVCVHTTSRDRRGCFWKT